MSAHFSRLHGVQGPSAAQQASMLPDLGEGLSAQLAQLARDPEPWRCEQMAVNLEGARMAVLRLREKLMADAEPPQAA